MENWIDVKDQIPCEYHEVQICICGNSVGTAVYEETENGWEFVNDRYGSEFEQKDITHWKPLDKPPVK